MICKKIMENNIIKKLEKEYKNKKVNKEKSENSKNTIYL